jgi:hypothetical protein
MGLDWRLNVFANLAGVAGAVPELKCRNIV